MITKPWDSPKSNSSESLDTASTWLLLPLYLTTEGVSEVETLEIVSACYKSLKLSEDKIPFTLAMENGLVLASFSNGQLVMDKNFKVCFEIFNIVLAAEKQLSVSQTLDQLEAMIKERDEAGIPKE